MAASDSQPKISIGLGGARKSKLPINNLKRPHSALFNDKDADDDDSHAAGGARKVSHFDSKAGGAIEETRQKSKGPLIIAPQKNRDWKEASKKRRQRGALPEQNGQDAQQQIAAIEEAERRERDRTFGLNVMRKDEEDDDDSPIDDAGQAAPPEAVPQAATVSNEKSADERAMDALLGRKEQSTLVVPAVSETDAFRDDFRSAPDMATLDDYARVPVEQFGAAMLRGMGWKDGDGVGTKKGTKTAKTESLIRRPALLGIGAKPDAAIDAELGGWGKAARGKEIKIYNPILLKDKKTGELVTEEELQKRRDEAQKMAFENEFDQRERDRERRRRRDHSDERTAHDDRRRRHHKEHDDEYDRSKRRERDRSRDDGRPRRHRDDSEHGRRDDRDRSKRDGHDRSRRDEREHTRHKDERRSKHDKDDNKHDRRRDRERDREGEYKRDRNSRR